MDIDKLNKLSNGQLNSNNVAYVEALYEDYLINTASVPEYWGDLFNKLTTGTQTAPSHSSVRQSLRQAVKQKYTNKKNNASEENNRKQVGVIRLISAYRYLGHRQADIEPLGITTRPDIPELSPEFHGLTHDGRC